MRIGHGFDVHALVEGRKLVIGGVTIPFSLLLVDVAKKTIALTFEITQGEITFIEKVNVLGNTKTSTQTILDLMSIKEGEPFHGTRLEASRKQLRRLFNEVVMSTKKGSTESSIELTVEVDE